MGFLKQVTNSGSASANEKLDEFRTGNDEKGNPCFTRNSFGKESFTGSGRTDKKDTFGDTSTDFGITVGRFQKIDNFGEFLFGFTHPSHIAERDAGLLIRDIDLRLAFGEAECSLGTTSHGTACKELQHQNENQGWNPPAQNGGEDIGLLGWSRCELNSLRLKALGQIHL